MSGLTASIGEHLAFQREGAAGRAGATAEDIRIARLTGFDPQDVMTIRTLCAARAILLVFRCPNLAARSLHGLLPAKTAVTSAKSGSSGAVMGANGLLMVSDYDIMGCWRQEGAGFRRIPITAMAQGAKYGAWSAEAREIVQALNRNLLTRIQHGAQDDWLDAEKNRGVKPDDGFLAFRLGVSEPLNGAAGLEGFYRLNGLDWPYLPNGRHRGR